MNQPSWIEQLEDEDLAFLKRFVLASGSLKDTAKHYGISYPTVRLRLDRLIAKIQVLEDQSLESPMERTVRVLFAEGRLDRGTMERLLAAHRLEGGEA